MHDNLKCLMWVFPKIGVPQNGWFTMEKPIKLDDLGVPLFSETSIQSLLLQDVPAFNHWNTLARGLAEDGEKCGGTGVGSPWSSSKVHDASSSCHHGPYPFIPSWSWPSETNSCLPRKR